MIGNLSKDPKIKNIAESFGVPVISSKDGAEYVDDDIYTVFVLEAFEGDVYNRLYKSRQMLLGPIALQQLANKKESLPHNTRPLYNLAMSGVVVCFTGFRNKDELVSNAAFGFHCSQVLYHILGNYIKNQVDKLKYIIITIKMFIEYQDPIIEVNMVHDTKYFSNLFKLQFLRSTHLIVSNLSQINFNNNFNYYCLF